MQQAQNRVCCFCAVRFDVECSPSVTREQSNIAPLQDMAAYGGMEGWFHSSTHS
jgi:hypothetical protein